MFVSWAARTAGVRFYSANAIGRGVKPSMLYGASVARIYDWARNAGLARGRTYLAQAGDLVIFRQPARASRYDHIGIVVEPASGGVIRVVAGDNVNPTAARAATAASSRRPTTRAATVLVGYVALSAAHNVG